MSANPVSRTASIKHFRQEKLDRFKDWGLVA